MYYGLRQPPETFKNRIRLTKKQRAIVEKLPCDLTDGEISSLGAINMGVTNKKCIRCLRCVAACKSKALFFERTFFMRLYLKKKPVDKTIVYV